MSAKFEIKKSKNDKFVFYLKAGNGEVILSSELYEAKANAVTGIASVKTNAPNDERFERRTSTKGDPYFVLKAGNSQMIGQSEKYSSPSAMEAGVASAKRNAPGADTVDWT